MRESNSIYLLSLCVLTQIQATPCSLLCDRPKLVKCVLSLLMIFTSNSSVVVKLFHISLNEYANMEHLFQL